MTDSSNQEKFKKARQAMDDAAQKLQKAFDSSQEFSDLLEAENGSWMKKILP